MRARSIARSGLIAPLVLLAAGAVAQQYTGLPETVLRGLYHPGSSYPIDEIYIFPLAATETAIAFASCPFVDLPDGSGGEGTACHIEWLEAQGDAFRPVRRDAISGCTIADHWNIDCPDFTAEGMTYGNSEKLLASLRKTYPMPADLFEIETGVTTDIVPLVVTGLEETEQIGEYAANRLQYDFGMLGDCGAYANHPAFADACARVMAVLTKETSVIGVTAMVIGERGLVCIIAADWSVPACSSRRPD